MKNCLLTEINVLKEIKSEILAKGYNLSKENYEIVFTISNRIEKSSIAFLDESFEGLVTKVINSLKTIKSSSNNKTGKKFSVDINTNRHVNDWLFLRINSLLPHPEDSTKMLIDYKSCLTQHFNGKSKQEILDNAITYYTQFNRK